MNTLGHLIKDGLWNFAWKEASLHAKSQRDIKYSADTNPTVGETSLRPENRVWMQFLAILRNPWDWLTVPAGSSIQQPVHRRQARLLSAVLVFTILSILMTEVITIIQFSPYGAYSGYWITFTTVASLGVAYFLSRTRHYKLAAVLTIGILSSAFFVSESYGGNPADVNFLVYLMAPLLLGSIFLSFQNLLILIMAYIVVTWLLPAFILEVDTPINIIYQSSFLIITSGYLLFIAHHHNIFEKYCQRELAEKKERYTALLENTHEGVCIHVNGEILDATPGFARLFGYELLEIMGMPVLDLMAERSRDLLARHAADPVEHPHEALGLRKDHSTFFIELIPKTQTYQGRIVGVLSIRDITERVHAQQELCDQKSLLDEIFYGMHEGISFLDENESLIYCNPAYADIFEDTVDNLIEHSALDFFDADSRSTILRHTQEWRAGKPSKHEVPLTTRKGSQKVVRITVSPRLADDGTYTGTFCKVMDITEQVQAEKRSRRQFQRLKALRDIDQVIKASMDLRVSLSVLLDTVRSQLSVDAADVLLLNPYTNVLEYTAGSGFRNNTAKTTCLRLQKGSIGRAILEHHPINLPNLSLIGDECERYAQLSNDGFVACFGMPLIAKGQIKGMLEVLHRSPLDLDQEWLDFFESLASQATIAIDNFQLFEKLQHSNSELVVAYDATLEGWAKALELRDQETKGHCQRVTYMTLHLARDMGISGQELIHLRRGALLHDIGKMGIPDHILLKPGPLTGDEWKTMHQHPVYAHEWLSSIPFLRPALDIPYCHHEKWDGTGYPRGLIAEQIPLSARIFAIVDVWDALLSDRPYRKAWPEERVREYIHSQTGKYFDPQVVDAFFNIVESTSASLSGHHFS